MDNRSFQSGAIASPPSAPASPSIGYPTNGDPGGTPATLPGEFWFHQVGEELRALLSAAGITPSTTDLGQVVEAIQVLQGSKIQPIAASVAANELTVTLNPTALDFRSVTLTSGAINTRRIASSISLVVPSGATLGSDSASLTRYVLLAIDNAGTVELAIVNIGGGNNLDETTLISTTAISSGATAKNVIYSASARTNVPFRVVGFLEATEATAGTWATAPSLVQGAGGNAMTQLGGFGFGQTPQDVTGSRALATTYTNRTGRPIDVNVTVTNTVNGGTCTITSFLNGTTWQSLSIQGGGGVGTTAFSLSLTVPPLQTYSFTTVQGNLSIWTELR